MRYTVTIPDKLVSILKVIAVSDEITLSEVMRKSIQLYCVLSKQVRDGAKVVIKKNGESEKELLL
jgi:hypothetical protein